MTSPWKEDPSMQIQLRCRRPEKNLDPAEKSYQHLTLAFLSPLIQPSIQHSCIHPALSQQHLHSLLTLSLSLYPSRSFSLLSLPVSRYLMFLSPLLIPYLHPIQAGGLQLGADVRKDKLWRLCAQANTVSYLNCSAREDISVGGKKKQTALEGNWDGEC